MIFFYKDMSKEKILAMSFWIGAFAIFYLFMGGFGVLTGEVIADSATTTATIGNATPTVSAITIAGPTVTLSEGTTITVTSTCTVTDNNGYADITAVAADFYDDDAQNYGCSDDENDCYADIVCATSSCADTQCSVLCTATVLYYANDTANWKWYITATDDDATSNSTSSVAITVSQLVALDVANSISYTTGGGNMALGGTSDGATTTITNTGNKSGLDAQVSATAVMTCDTGTLNQSAQHYATSTSGFAYGDGVALSDSATNAGMGIAQRTDATTTDNVYWKLQIPSSGVEGSCSGVNTFIAN